MGLSNQYCAFLYPLCPPVWFFMCNYINNGFLKDVFQYEYV